MSKERKFKVIALAVTGRSNEVFRNVTEKKDKDGNFVKERTILKESQLVPGTADDLVKQGFIEEVKSGKSNDDSGSTDVEVEQLSLKYLELSGKESHPKTWGKPKLQSEIDNLLSEKFEALKKEYLELSEVEEVPEDWDANTLEIEIETLKKGE